MHSPELRRRRVAVSPAKGVWTEFPGGPRLLQALNVGAIDFGTTGEAPPIFAQAAGAPLLYVGYEPPAPKGEAILVPKDSLIADVAGLQGRKVAVNEGWKPRGGPGRVALGGEATRPARRELRRRLLRHAAASRFRPAPAALRAMPRARRARFSLVPIRQPLANLCSLSCRAFAGLDLDRPVRDRRRPEWRSVAA